MTKVVWIVVGALLIGSAASIALFMWRQGIEPTPEYSAVIAPPERTVDPSSLAIYANGEYGFSFFYPATSVLEDLETGSDVWRIGARDESGTRIVEVTTSEGMVRVGQSALSPEVEACLSPGPAEVSSGITRIGSTTWHVFNFSRLGTDAEERVYSYRTVNGGACTALEALLPLSTTLEATLGPRTIVESFSFAE